VRRVVIKFKYLQAAARDFWWRTPESPVAAPVTGSELHDGFFVTPFPLFFYCDTTTPFPTIEA
jgi:hypothetical protein